MPEAEERRFTRAELFRETLEAMATGAWVAGKGVHDLAHRAGISVEQAQEIADECAAIIAIGLEPRALRQEVLTVARFAVRRALEGSNLGAVKGLLDIQIELGGLKGMPQPEGEANEKPVKVPVEELRELVRPAGFDIVPITKEDHGSEETRPAEARASDGA